MKNIIAAAFAVAALGTTAPVFAQDPAAAAAPAAESAAAKAGDTVYDQAGEIVGTIEQVEGDKFVISTGTNRATLALAALGTGPKGHTLAMNKQQLDAAIEQATAGAPAAQAPAEETPAN